MSNKKSYCIRKYRTIKASDSDKTFEEANLMTNSHCEVQEYDNKDVVDKVVESMNTNTDSNCRYETVTI